ncbi:gamma-D-glutamyl-L-lysine endopeptidase [Moorella thermoacetica]|uniref:Gamma-D-glutamyl-L-lysine endopeptidase n=1 Tax=Neomoorella thermoacetica TaxID=1525 RepID=A0A1J5JJ55_NEOTH|nr:gamma-D-glutamyl-L-lysine endopeptidase [Moorella thermoacetica]OIQ58783.1 gamma-D-glutamyl-L-lysine endopeptidase [Moorella thermoacetica]
MFKGGRYISIYYFIIALAMVIAGGFLLSRQAKRLPPPVQLPPGATTPRAESWYVGVAVADVRANPDQGAERVTQALLGDEVKLLRDEGEWLQGQVPDGYIGWLRKGNLVRATPPLARDLVAVRVPRAILYKEPGGDAQAGEALLGTDLPLLAQKEDWLEVWLPGRLPAWLSRQEVDLWPGGQLTDKRSGSDVIKVAERLEGVAYLWGGVSLYGIDCSGLTYIAYFLNGVKLPRDADLQFKVGRPVARKDLQPGDLVFFNTSGGTQPTHVGIYTGNGQFLNSRSRQGVVVSRLDEPSFSAGYLGARRYLP